MKSINLIALIFLAHFAVNFISARKLECKWKSPSGEVYDFSDLHKKDGYTVKDPSQSLGMFDILYITNVCETVTCNSNEVSVYEGLQIMGEKADNCDVLTNANTLTYGYIDSSQPGIGVEWTHTGEQCIQPPRIAYDENNNIVNQPAATNEIRKSTFNIFCSDEQNSNFVIDTTDGCHLKFRMSSPTACIGASSAHYSSFKILFFIIFAGSIYFITGCYMNKRKYGLTGIESLPHYSFWTDLPFLIQDGFKLTLIKTTSLIRYVKSKSGASTSTPTEANTGTYNTI